MKYLIAPISLVLLFSATLPSCKEVEQPTQQVNAAFTSDKTEISAGESVQFTDESTGAPSSWLWSFDGGTPATSTEQNPTVTYNTDGNFKVTLQVSNASSSDSVVKEEYVKVNCTERYCSPKFSSFTKSATVSYGADAGQHQMIIYEPEGDTETKRATVLLLGGGGFQSGSNLDFLEPVATNLTKYGLVVAVARYRVNSILPAQTQLLNAQQDSRTAVRFLKKEATTYGIDTNQIFAGGYSAGGFAALFHAYVDMDDLSIPERLVINQVGGIEGYAQGNPGYGSDVKGVISLAGGMFLTLNPITTADVPIFAVHGTADTETPYDREQTTFGSKAITEKVAEIGLKSVLYTIEGGSHEDARTKSDDYVEDLMEFIVDVIE